MADITMCGNNRCEMRNTCYRQRAKPSNWQSLAVFTPKDEDCEYYIEYVPHEHYSGDRRSRGAVTNGNA